MICYLQLLLLVAPLVPVRLEVCPTMGTSAFLLITISSSLDYEGFVGLLTYYARLMPLHETISYKLNFGTNVSISIETDSLGAEIEAWLDDSDQMHRFWRSARTNCSALTQCGDSAAPLSAVIRSFFDIIAEENQHPLTVALKKQVVLLTDYVPVNVVDAMNTITNDNEQKFGLFHELNTSEFELVAAFPVYSVADDVDISRTLGAFQKPLGFQFPSSVYQGKPWTRSELFMTEFDASTVLRLLENAMSGDLCRVPNKKMYGDFLAIRFAHNGSVHRLTIPFIGERTTIFGQHCVDYVKKKVDLAFKVACDDAAATVFEQFVASTLQSSHTFISMLITSVSCNVERNANLSATPISKNYVQFISAQDLSEVYELLTFSLLHRGYLNSSVDWQVVLDDSFYLTNFSTMCKSSMPLVPLLAAQPYHKLRHLYIAMDDMLWITMCATISVSVSGILIYQQIKRKHKKQMEILTEMMLQPNTYKTARECPKVARLPWEIKSDHVHIDREFLLGEGTISNVYLGKLKGKAPILQWIGRVEMKQFQDCPVAVRVPRHFDEPEEDQLFREISSMRRLRHHDHIALFLGWTNKNDLVCSLLELTHMNLLKYLGQIKETVSNGEARSTAYIPYQMLYKIIWEICDGMSYIHSRSLIHRDLAARNVLLTTGLRAKISGFGFCSDANDPRFSGNSLAVRYLPVRWLAPECFHGKFSQSSDTWSFGVLLYEIFTLGDVPYDDLQKPEEIMECVLHFRIPAHPKYASRQNYNLMQQCFHRFPERRPLFAYLKDNFQTEMEALFVNTAYAEDDEH